MSFRTPPRMATWLLQHLGPRYRNDSLAGDLNEEFQLHRTHAWYWRQVIAAVCIGRMMRLGELARRLSRPSRSLTPCSPAAPDLLRPSLQASERLVTSAIFRLVLRVATEAGVILGAIALAGQLRHACSLGQVPEISSIMTLIGAIGLCFSVGTYLSTCISPALRHTPRARRNTSTRRRVAVFAATALSAGTLTWASSTTHTHQVCMSVEGGTGGK